MLNSIKVLNNEHDERFVQVLTHQNKNIVINSVCNDRDNQKKYSNFILIECSQGLRNI